uniref:Glycosyltransferase n=1 Tax=candidate division WOR-3 bacterium TaxID=2052148 RepID=A0A7V0Z6Q1_UNCW3
MKKFTSQEIKEFVSKAMFDEKIILNKDHSYPKISIVTPSYNQAEFLERTILSVLNQNYPNLEYIIIDGGSTDNTLDIIHHYAKKLAFFQSKPDDGQADAIKQGFARATGDILLWVNSDDLLLPDALTDIARYFIRHPNVDLVIGRSIIIDSDARVLRKIWPVKPSFESLYYWGCGFNQVASAWRRTLYDDVGGIDPSLHFCMDYDLYLRFLHKCKVGIIPRYLAAYRIHSASKSSTLRKIQVKERRLIKQKWFGHPRLKCNPQLIKLHTQLQAYIQRGIARTFTLPPKIYAWLSYLHSSPKSE